MLGSALGPNMSLTKLGLGGCKLHDEGVRAILRPLRGPCSLQSLELQRNHITAHGASAVSAFLAGSPRAGGPSRIAHLDLSHNSVGDLGISLLSNSLCEAAALRSLILQDCDIGVAGAAQTLLICRERDAAAVANIITAACAPWMLFIV